MQPVADPIHFAELWNLCRDAGWRVKVHRHTSIANGMNDQFVVAIHQPNTTTSAAEVRTTNLESAAALLLDRYRNHITSD